MPLVPPGSLSHYLSVSHSVSLNYSDKSRDLKSFFFNLKKFFLVKSCRAKL